MSYKWLFAIPVAVLAIVGGILINDNLGHSPTKDVVGLINIDNSDQGTNWNKYPTYDITLSETLNIYKSGTYNITGSLSDGSININATNGLVRLILDNVIIENSNGPAISCISGDQLVIESKGVNYLKDGANYSNSLDADINGVIYSKADLFFTGDGSINIVSNYQDGIVSKDDLTIRSGSFNISSKDDGIRGKDSVRITGGNISIVAGADAIKSTNETDNTKGYVYIENGTIKISCADDGIHATKYLIVDNGDIQINKSYEGIEAPLITLNGGNISVTSSDDGINAGTGTSTSNTPRPGGVMDADENCIVTINDGNIYVNSGGDGIDSNGYVYINGGVVVVDGPTNNGNGALDAGLGFVVKGGKSIAIGSSGMAETFGNDSTINSISFYLSSVYPADSHIVVKNSSGDTIVEHTSAKTFSHIAVASSELMIGETYNIYINNSSVGKITLISTVTSNRNNNNGAGGPGGMMPGRR